MKYKNKKQSNSGSFHYLILFRFVLFQRKEKKKRIKDEHQHVCGEAQWLGGGNVV